MGCGACSSNHRDPVAQCLERLAIVLVGRLDVITMVWKAIHEDGYPSRRVGEIGDGERAPLSIMDCLLCGVGQRWPMAGD